MPVTRISSDNLLLLSEAVVRFRDGGGDETDPSSFVDAPCTLAFVAVEAAEVIGWCWGHHLPRPDASPMLYLHQLDVDEAHRRQGIGRSLLRAFLSTGKEAGATRAFLTTAQTNAPARSLYESLGGSPATQGPTVTYWFSQLWREHGSQPLVWAHADRRGDRPGPDEPHE